VLNKPSIVSVGAGNLATHLIQELYSKGYSVLSVYSRKIKTARKLAEVTASSYTDNYEDLPAEAGIYIISVTDDAISSAVAALAGTHSVVVHTAGSVDISVFVEKVSRYGVIYPLQTFSKGRKVNFSSIPFLLEASDKETMRIIRNLVSDISENSTEMNSAERRWVHLAAVFACNFTNYMFTCASDILERKNIGFELLFPLIEETTRKAVENNPSLMQTGPAVRGNVNIMNDHIRLLSDYPEWQKIYNFVSQAILEHYHFRNRDKTI
jgi:predicted short-subunit dehydrogenase-like oxidoreductase (DUF2520 family)